MKLLASLSFLVLFGFTCFAQNAQWKYESVVSDLLVNKSIHQNIKKAIGRKHFKQVSSNDSLQFDLPYEKVYFGTTLRYLIDDLILSCSSSLDMEVDTLLDLYDGYNNEGTVDSVWYCGMSSNKESPLIVYIMAPIENTIAVQLSFIQKPYYHYNSTPVLGMSVFVLYIFDEEGEIAYRIISFYRRISKTRHL